MKPKLPPEIQAKFDKAKRSQEDFNKLVAQSDKREIFIPPVRQKPLLALTMILKDEAASIREVLEAAKPFVDSWVILDTGSTDGTQKIVEEVMNGLPGVLFGAPFVDFKTARNLVLDVATGTQGSCKEDGSEELICDKGKAVSDGSPCPHIHWVADFCLMLSGDEYLRDGDKLRELLEEQRNPEPGAQAIDLFCLRVIVDNESRADSPRVFRNGSAWRYEDDGCGVHEFPANVDKSAPVGMIHGTTIDHVVSDSEKRLSNIWDVHVPLLKAKLETDPNNARALIFLAQSYENLFEFFEPGDKLTYVMEAMSLYLRRLALPIETAAERNLLRRLYLQDARLSGVYTDSEIFVRAEELVKDDPNSSDAALLLVFAATRVLPISKVFQLAVYAAGVAAANTDSQSQVSLSCAWKAHHTAATAAKAIMSKLGSAENQEQFLEWGVRLREQVTAGLAAGGPWEMFKGFSEKPTPINDVTVPMNVTIPDTSSETTAP